MNFQPHFTQVWQPVLQLVRSMWRTWLSIAVVTTLVAAAYALLRKPTWEASQTLLLRNEAANNQEGPGRFRHLDDMKVTQETVLAVSKSHRVLAAALADVHAGDDAAKQSGARPAAAAEAAVADLRSAVELVPPKGAEFGKTEILDLKVRDQNGARAVARAAAISRHLQAELRRLRDSKAQSMIAELTRATGLAEAELLRANRQLAELEAQVGSDLGDLRMLDVTATGDSDLRRRLNAIEDELRQARVALQANQALQAMLERAQSDPGQLLATPNRLLESQPALRRLKDGLVDAQLQRAALEGTMSQHHPLVIAARDAQAQIARHLHDELAVALRGVEIDLALTAQRAEQLEALRRESLERLNRLAVMRAEYSRLAAEVRHRTQLLEDTRRNLAAALADREGARGASLITVLDEPRLGSTPLGPSRAMIILAGLFCGLAGGLGVVLLAGSPWRPTIDPATPTTTQAANAAGMEVSTGGPGRVEPLPVREIVTATIGAAASHHPPFAKGKGGVSLR